MSYYWFNREKFEKCRDKYHNKGGKKNLLSIILLIKTF